MKNIVIVIAGSPATGKTTYGNKISKKLSIPIFSKDKLKEVIYDSMEEDKLEYEAKRKIGIASYSVLWAICEEIMKTGSIFIIESNFTNASSIKINELLNKYHYKSIVIKFDADIRTLHQRFLEREKKTERHPGLVADGIFDDFEKFKEIAKKAKNFELGDNKEILVDTTDFSKVDFKWILEELKRKIKDQKYKHSLM